MAYLGAHQMEYDGEEHREYDEDEIVSPAEVGESYCRGLQDGNRGKHEDDDAPCHVPGAMHLRKIWEQ